MFIDIHVHARDGKQSYKETISHLLSVAERTGFSGVASIGNGDPATINEEAFLFYQDKAVKANSPVQFYQWILITPETKQVEKAIKLWDKYEEIIGFKMFGCYSIGDTKVDQRKDQRKVFEVLTKNNYEGVLMIHCEKEDFITKEFDHKNPISHCQNRPPVAEITSVCDMISDSLEQKYKGKIHICHISCPESIEIVNMYPNKEKISTGITPHHLIMCDLLMLEENKGIYRKVNPPLRNWEKVQKMSQYFQSGFISIYESDHAPHTKKEKENSPYLSGFPVLPIFPLFLKYIKLHGMSDKNILDHTFNNIKKIFAPKLNKVKPRKDISLNNLEELIKEVPKIRKEYDYDAWEGIL